MNDKLKSRKFMVWVTATVLLVLSFVAYFIVRENAITEVMKMLAESWGWISALYIGGNVAQKCLTKNHEATND